MQKANKTYNCNDLEVGSTLSKQLAKGKAVSLEDFCLPEKLLKTACWRCRRCTRNQSGATRRKCRVDYLREFYSFPECGGSVFGRRTTLHHRLTTTMASLARAS